MGPSPSLSRAVHCARHTSQVRHISPSRTGTARSQTESYPVPAYVQRTSRQPESKQTPIPRPCRRDGRLRPRTSRRPQAARHRSHTVPYPGPSAPPNVTSAQAEQAPVPRPCRTLFPSMSKTSRRPKPDRRQSQDRAVPCICLRPNSVTPAQAEHALIPRSRRTQYPGRTKNVTPTQPNSQRSKYRSASGPYTTKNGTPVPAEQVLVPIPYRTLCPSQSQERRAGPSRAGAGP